MKKLLLIGILAATGNIFSQEGHWCGFDQHQQKIYESNPGLYEREMAIEDEASDNGYMFASNRTAIYTVPVVVHVIHDGGESNISYEQIESAIAALNLDFNALNTDLANVRNTADAPFVPVIADAQIEFALAKIDENGNCTNGVERRYSPGVTIDAGENAKYYSSGGLNQWDPSMYMNIWVVTSIDDGGDPGDILGYAEFPGNSMSNSYGVLIRHDRMGTIGTSNTSRTLTHEIGHCFKLYHTFQGGCHSSNCSNNGDRCCDTPPLDEAHWSCVSTQNFCAQVPTGDAYGTDVFDQFENHMSYSPCRVMFTQDQKARMHYFINQYGWLSNLCSASNATATGIDGPSALCSVEFSSTTTVICAGSTVSYEDESYFNVTGTNWTFEGGTPGTSTVSNPTVTYNTPGIYDVTLQVTDGSGSITSTSTDYVIVLADPGVPFPYSEGFETLPSFPDELTFSVQNDDNGQEWDMISGVGATGSKCVKLNNYGVTNNSLDAFMSGPIDLSALDSTDDVIFTFKYAYKKRSSTNSEKLKLYVSKDCGETWALRKNLQGTTLGSTTQTSPYTPSGESDWTEVTVTNINSDYYVSNFRYKFEFENDSGNNIYIDDININLASQVSLNELISFDEISIYPNPVTDIMDIRIDATEGAMYTIQLVNALGQQIGVIYNGTVSGMTTLSYNTSDLPGGIYFLVIEHSGLIETRKVVKK